MNIVGELSELCIAGFDPRRQLLYRLAHGLSEVVQFPSIHRPVKGSTDVGAVQPEFDVSQFVNLGVLDYRETEGHCRRVGGYAP